MTPLRVLVVDDEPEIRQSFSLLLAGRGCECATASGGLEALSLLEQRDFDVLLTDLRMPGMDGLQLLERASALHPDLVSVLLTGEATKDDVVVAIKHNVFDYVEKPLRDGATLGFVVERAGDRARLVRERNDLLGALRRQNARLEQNLASLRAAYETLVRQEADLKADLGCARRMQQSLLPSAFPRFERLELFGYYQPCDVLGGDFFDLVPLGGGRAAAYVADVAGHGVRSALVTVIVHQLLHSHRMLQPDSEELAHPAQALAYLNRGLSRHPFGEPIHVTMGYAVVETESGRLRYASAGHPRALLVRGPGGAQWLGPGGPALGLEERPRFEEAQAQLGEGDLLLVYSDGLLESGGEIGPARLAEQLGPLHGRGAAEAGAALEHCLRSCREGASPRDDISFLALARTRRAAAGAGAPVPGSVRIVAAEPPAAAPAAAGELAVGSAQGVPVVRATGRLTWQNAPALAEALGAPRGGADAGVHLDLAGCTGLDSTVLGLLFQHRGRLLLHRPDARVRRQLEELGIGAHLTLSDEPAPVPGSLELPRAEATREQQLRLIVAAHEVLAASSEENRARFGAAAELLRNDLAGKQGDGGRRTD